jgi:hypothetical protein
VEQTLDDFDFTVLAATSVLGDLMEKCPPAEACRDAFERMSKATVQMCMSTPGFGFSTEREEPPRHSNKHSSNMVPMQIDSYPHSRLAPKPIMKRPPPKFDMDLRELFPEDLEPSARPSQSFPQPLAGLQRPAQHGPAGFQHILQAQPQPQPQQQQQSPRRPLLSPSSSINSQISTNLNNSQLYNNNTTTTTTPSQPFYMQNTYNPDFMSSVPGMDFLNTVTSGAGDDFNFDTAGIDLGFGMGLDYQHDWSDAQQYDLLDGFFFGNGNGNNGTYGNGNGNGNDGSGGS